MNNFFSTIEESFNDLFHYSTPKDPETTVVSINSHEGTLGYLTNYRFKNIRDVGSYIIIINSSISNAIFAISKTNKRDNGLIVNLCSTGNKLNLRWNPGEYPYLECEKYEYNKDRSKNKKIDFYIKIITSF